MAELDGIRLESTTDTPEQVNEALGISNEQETPEAPATEETAETPPASETPAAPAEAEPPSDDDTDEPDDDPETESEGDTASETETQPRTRPRRRRDYQKRINQLVADRNQEREAREALERRLAALEQRSQQPQAAEPDDNEGDEQPSATDGRPDPDAFDNYDDYVDALTQWRAEQIVEQREKARDQREREQREAQERETRERTWTEKLDAARNKYDDWDEIFSEGTVLVSPAVGEVVQTSDVGTDLLYHLGNDPALLDRLNRLPSVIQVAKELGRIEAQIISSADTPPAQDQPPAQPTATQPETATETAPPVRQANARPAPINPVTPSTTSTPKSPDEMDYEEYKAWRANGGGR